MTHKYSLLHAVERRGPCALLGRILIIAAAISCSKSDSDRTIGADSSEGSRSSSVDQDETAFAPQSVAGSFLAGVQECSTFVVDELLKIGCSLVDARSGQHILAKFASVIERSVWTLSVDGHLLPDSASDRSTRLALVSGLDQVWTLGRDGQAWPSTLVPGISVTLKDGTPAKNSNISSTTKAALKLPPSGSKTAVAVLANAGSSGGTATFTSSQAIVFATSIAFPSPNRVLTDPTVALHFSNCVAYQQALGTAFDNEERKLTVAANTVCQCMAEGSQLEPVRNRRTSYFAVLKTEANLSQFYGKISANQVKPLYDTKGNLVANGSQLFTSDLAGLRVQVTMANPIAYDENSQPVGSSENLKYAWTGIDIDAATGMQGLNAADCNHWVPNDFMGTAVVGQIGGNGNSSITSNSPLSCATGKAAYYCASQ